MSPWHVQLPPRARLQLSHPEAEPSASLLLSTADGEAEKDGLGQRSNTATGEEMYVVLSGTRCDVGQQPSAPSENPCPTATPAFGTASYTSFSVPQPSTTVAFASWILIRTDRESLYFFPC